MEPEPELVDLSQTLESRHCVHGGIPVGALLVSKQRVNDCRMLLDQYKLRLVAVSSTVSGRLLLHLPPEAAAALDQPAEPSQQPLDDDGTANTDRHQLKDRLGEALHQFVQDTGALYYPSVRLFDPVLKRKGLPCLQLKPGPLVAPALLPPSNGFRFAEIFAGIGGFRAGLEPLGGTYA